MKRRQLLQAALAAPAVLLPGIAGADPLTHTHLFCVEPHEIQTRWFHHPTFLSYRVPALPAKGKEIMERAFDPKNPHKVVLEMPVEVRFYDRRIQPWALPQLADGSMDEVQTIDSRYLHRFRRYSIFERALNMRLAQYARTFQEPYDHPGVHSSEILRYRQDRSIVYGQIQEEVLKSLHLVEIRYRTQA